MPGGPSRHRGHTCSPQRPAKRGTRQKTEAVALWCDAAVSLRMHGTGPITRTRSHEPLVDAMWMSASRHASPCVSAVPPGLLCADSLRTVEGERLRVMACHRQPSNPPDTTRKTRSARALGGTRGQARASCSCARRRVRSACTECTIRHEGNRKHLSSLPALHLPLLPPRPRPRPVRQVWHMTYPHGLFMRQQPRGRFRRQAAEGAIMACASLDGYSTVTLFARLRG